MIGVKDFGLEWLLTSVHEDNSIFGVEIAADDLILVHLMRDSNGSNRSKPE